MHAPSKMLFKASVCYFLSNFYFPPNDNPLKTMKNVLKTMHAPSKMLFKASVCYFLSNVYFPPNDNPSKTMKNVFYFI